MQIGHWLPISCPVKLLQGEREKRPSRQGIAVVGLLGRVLGFKCALVSEHRQVMVSRRVARSAGHSGAGAAIAGSCGGWLSLRGEVGHGENCIEMGTGRHRLDYPGGFRTALRV
jgi:hypothetical protein